MGSNGHLCRFPVQKGIWQLISWDCLHCTYFDVQRYASGWNKRLERSVSRKHSKRTNAVEEYQVQAKTFISTRPSLKTLYLSSLPTHPLAQANPLIQWESTAIPLVQSQHVTHVIQSFRMKEPRRELNLMRITGHVNCVSSSCRILHLILSLSICCTNWERLDTLQLLYNHDSRNNFQAPVFPEFREAENCCFWAPLPNKRNALLLQRWATMRT